MTHLKRITISLTALALLATPFARADAPAPNPAPDSAELLHQLDLADAQIQSLQNQIKSLQQQLGAMRTGVPNFKFVPPGTPFYFTPQLNNSAPGTPPAAIAHPFNGGVFYVIPIQAH